MFSWFTRNRPLAVVEQKLVSLKDTIDESVSGLRHEHAYPERVFGRLFGRNSSFASLRSSVWKESIAFTVYHAVSCVGLEDIGRSFWAFSADFEELHRRIPSAHSRRTKGYLNGIRRATRKLGVAINVLHEQVRSERIRVVQSHGRYRREFVKIREAMAVFDGKGATNLNGDEVDYFCEWPGVDLEDPEQLERIAKLIPLDHVRNQEYELRCRLDKPGRPLMQARCLAFPSVEEVESFALSWDLPKKIFVAATKPTWRVAWVFERQNGGWYW